jgi:hypothetical protein
MYKREEKCIHCFFWRGESEGKKLMGRPRCSLENIFKVDHQEMGWDGMYWIHLVLNKGR